MAAKDLELDEDLPFQKRVWRVQRWSWGIFSAVLVLALLGFFGSGAASKARVEQGPYSIEYDRYVRRESPVQWTLSAAPSGAQDDPLTVELNREYLEKTKVDTIDPEPLRTQATAKGQRYFFAVEKGAAKPIQFLFRASAEKAGPLEVRVKVGKESLEFGQFVYP
jgi:hypothetical protein